MTKRKKHIGEKDVQRYLENKMTDAERNAFERELQKHPFEAEALEGFQQISPDDLTSDLMELHSEITSKKQKPRYRYWAAAATILLLVTSGILWFQLKDETPVPTIAENKTIAKEDTVIEPQINSVQKPMSENEIFPKVQEETGDLASEKTYKPEEAKETALKEPEIKAAKTPPVSKNQSLTTIDNLAQMDNEVNVPGEKNIADMEFQDKIVPPNNFVKASVVSSENESQNNKYFDTARLIEPGFVQPELKLTLKPADTIRFESIIPDEVNSGQVIIRGLGKPEINESVSSAIKVESNVAVSPKGGMEKFNKYLEEKAVLPGNYKKNRAIVKIQVNFDRFGGITGFTNKNEADPTLFELAKQIIQDGSEWSPEIRNRQPVNSGKEIKIIFKKKK